MSIRKLERVIDSRATSDGAGVRLRRSLGKSPHARLDPFLMLDEFDSEDSADYIGGFPSHPHRGFETVTYMLDGHMLHEDHMGNKGHLKAGDVQWMTAGKGVIHSEMPQQEQGRMRGFQLWINLPADEKMKPAFYRDILDREIPVFDGDGFKVKVVAGKYNTGSELITGPITGLTTDPIYFDVQLDARKTFSVGLPIEHSCFIYVYEGQVTTSDNHIDLGQAGILVEGDQLEFTATESAARLLLLAGKPINEPVAQHGPFVMNTREEIEQALHDYASGTLTD